MYIYIYTYVLMYVYIYTYICICVCVCVCVNVCMCINVYACICTHIYPSIFIYTYMCIGAPHPRRLRTPRWPAWLSIFVYIHMYVLVMYRRTASEKTPQAEMTCLAIYLCIYTYLHIYVSHRIQEDSARRDDLLAIGLRVRVTYICIAPHPRRLRRPRWPAWLSIFVYIYIYVLVVYWRTASEKTPHAEMTCLAIYLCIYTYLHIYVSHRIQEDSARRDDLLAIGLRVRVTYICIAPRPRRLRRPRWPAWPWCRRLPAWRRRAPARQTGQDRGHDMHIYI